MAEDNRRTQAIQALKEAAARAELSCEHVKISPEACRIIIGMLADPGWISVKDRLPEEQINPNTNDFEYVLCATTFGDVRAYKYGMINGDTEAHFWHGFGIVDKYITHWMPLPERPQ